MKLQHLQTLAGVAEDAPNEFDTEHNTLREAKSRAHIRQLLEVGHECDVQERVLKIIEVYNDDIKHDEVADHAMAQTVELLNQYGVEYANIYSPKFDNYDEFKKQLASQLDDVTYGPLEVGLTKRLKEAAAIFMVVMDEADAATGLPKYLMRLIKLLVEKLGDNPSDFQKKIIISTFKTIGIDEDLYTH
jgi:hypothetical protein